MAEETQNNEMPKPQQDGWTLNTISEEEKRNLLGFFELLIKVDKRINSHLYKNEYK